MVRAERVLCDRQGAFEERAGGRVVALRFVQRGKVVEAGGGGRMGGPERVLPDRQGAGVEREGRRVLPLRLVS
jgi:hypothetical protein